MKLSLVTALIVGFVSFAHADEGMWLFNQPPREILRERHQFEPADAWLEHLQKSSVRIGASGSFVSEDGLLISNHHVGASDLQKLSTKEKNYLRDGFYAHTPAEEIKCLDLEINVLQSIEDVSVRVNAAIPKDADAATAFAARRKIIAEIEKDSLDKTGLRSDVVTLWQGGTYQLYRYKRYTDVRIVFAPEQQAAFFGGDPDNFEFPRYDFDICLFRAYENGQPAQTKNFLKFSPTGPRDGELVFVSGHPGGTSRLLTMTELDNLRDLALPYRLAVLKREEVLLGNWSARGQENARRAREYFFSVQNSRKALDGRLAGLLDPQLMGTKSRAEAGFKAQLAGKPEFSDALDAYAKIASATKTIAANATRFALFERGDGFDSAAFRYARTLVRAADEQAKPNGDRLREYSDANKPSLELGLFSTQPVYTDLEILTLSDSLTFFETQMGPNDPLVQKVLAGKSPHDRAIELINHTQMRDVAFRKKLYEGGTNAILSGKDPMIELVRRIDADARAVRKIVDEQNEVKQQAHVAIARAANALLGTGGSRYPDATGTLRLSFGTVKGYEEDDQSIPPFTRTVRKLIYEQNEIKQQTNAAMARATNSSLGTVKGLEEEGQFVPAFTTFAGLYNRAKEFHEQPPFDLPTRWEKGRSRLNLKTPLNFVSTADIIGGNSGSPVVNRAGEFVGIIFDGNLESLPWDYAFDDQQGRATSVDSAAILEGLDKIYHAKELVRELLDGKRSAK